MVLPIGQPGQLLVGDFNGDGNMDLIIKTYRGPLIWELGPDYGLAEVNLVLLLGDGQGGFAPPTTLLTSKGSLVAQLVADVNSDGYQDLVIVRRHITVEYARSEIQVMLGDGRGGLAPPLTLFEINDIPRDIAVADLNGDGHLDFVVAHLIAEAVSVFLADGRGGFRHHGSIQLVTDPAHLPERLVLADFNEDGHLDLAIGGEVYEAHDQRTRFVTVFLGDGKGGFPHRSFFMTFDPPESEVPWINLIALDYDYDGNVDLITSRQDEILLLLGNGDGTFTLDEEFWFPASDPDPLIAAVTDFNQDDCWDWVISSNSPPWWGLEVTVGSCGARSGAAFGWASRLYVPGVAVVDLNSDGYPDVVYVTGHGIEGEEMTRLWMRLSNMRPGERR